MNTYEITRALEHDPVTSKQFCGVFPSDKLPRTIDKYPCGFVANTDPSSEPETHWLAFYFPSEGKGEFFDSYGHAPEYYRKSFGNFLKTRTWDFNKRKSAHVPHADRMIPNYKSCFPTICADPSFEQTIFGTFFFPKLSLTH